MGISREDVRRACEVSEKAVVQSDSIVAAAKYVMEAINATGNYFSSIVNPVHGNELPYIIASLDSIVEHLKTIDKGATETAAEMKELFTTRSVGVSGVLAEAMRAMENRNYE